MKKYFLFFVMVMFMLVTNSYAITPDDYNDGVVEETPELITPTAVYRTGEVITDDLLSVQVLGGGVVLLTYAVNGEFSETEAMWKDIKILNPYNEECTIPDMVNVECPNMPEWNALVKELNAL